MKKLTKFKDINGKDIRDGDVLIPSFDFYGNKNPKFVGKVSYSDIDSRWEVFTDHPADMRWWVEYFEPVVKNIV